MYTELSKEVQDAIKSKFTLRYFAQTVIGQQNQSWNTNAVFVRRNHPADRPISLFKMMYIRETKRKVYRIKNLHECLPEDMRVLTPMRVFLLNMLVEDILRSVIADDYISLFIYSAIPHMPDIFLNHKFQIRKRERQDEPVVYLGYKKLTKQGGN